MYKPDVEKCQNLKKVAYDNIQGVSVKVSKNKR